MVERMDEDVTQVQEEPVGDLLQRMRSGMETRTDEVGELGFGKAAVREKLKEKELGNVLADVEPTQENVIPALQTVQDRYGYLPRKALEFVAERHDTTIARVYGIVTFYSQFYLKPQGEYTIKICDGTACHVKGSDDIIETIKDELGIEVGEVTDDGKFALKTVRCLGCCSLAPVIMINDEVYGNLTDEKVKKVLKDYE